MLRRITLTFDNGPDARVTPLVLDVLARHGVKSTFFVLGEKAERPECAALIRREVDAGHWVGNHTYSHRKPLGLLPADDALREFLEADRAIAAAGIKPKLFRPYGGGGKMGTHLLQPCVIRQLLAEAYTCVLWNSVPGDWRDPDGWLARALNDAETRDWSLIVLHDISEPAMKHLDAFLTEVRKRGHEVVQEFPPDCLPIVDGRPMMDLAPIGG